ncbi:hypothetical protein MRY87_07815 [bacterium]|nr:hypothetical protein [bacterium]
MQEMRNDRHERSSLRHSQSDTSIDRALPRPERRRRLLEVILGTAMLFLLLGIGNLIVGTQRTEHYAKLLKAYPITAGKGALPSSESPKEESNEAFQSLRERYDYYRFCLVGGKYFLALSGCLFLAALIALGIYRNELALRDETQ